ncbi:cation:proton antiporter [Marinibaculum pumilum]|uniref:Cation:proton antiporter n=1 Tax=Marinibaculum pumilum TaxID=1766165 RepID=A0ABV7KUD6_9PROT
MEDLVAKAALVLALGIAAQWLAWRYQFPAIVLLALAGIAVGPVGSLLHPVEDFGPLLSPVIALAVAIILFEGGINLQLRELRGTAAGVRRLTLVGAPLGWLLGAGAAHWIGGLSWPTSAVFGGILVVTGPTVIAPLLRQARLDRKPATTLKWEGIVNDPLGALFAVLAYEVTLALDAGGNGVWGALAHVLLGAVLAAALGVLAGLGIAWAFRRGLVPEFLKAPLVLGTVLASFALANAYVEETGLVAVTVLGLTIGNARIAAFEEMRRLKEVLATVLVSGVFILLTATLDTGTLLVLDWHHLLYLAAVLLLVRPATVLLSLAGTGVPWRHRALLSWIAPRGIVAVAISGLFGAKLAEAGHADGALLVPLSFAIVLLTVLLHGFSLRPLARLLGLASAEPPGLLLVGANSVTTALAEALAAMQVPAILADTSWQRLRPARHAGLRIYHGEMLSEVTEHHLDFANIGTVLAATENDSYNALVCSDLGPEIGQTAVFQVGPEEPGSNPARLAHDLGGAVPPAFSPGLHVLRDRLWQGWSFQKTRLTEKYDAAAYLADRADEAVTVLVVRQDGRIQIARDEQAAEKAGIGDIVLALVPPDATGRRRRGGNGGAP